MTTRRRILAGLGAAVAASAQRGGAPPILPADSPINQLKSRRSEARPITVEERKARLARAQELMHENKIDAIVLTGGTSLEYFGAIRSMFHPRLKRTGRANRLRSARAAKIRACWCGRKTRVPMPASPRG